MATKPLLSPLHFYYTPKLFEFVSSIHISALVYQLRLNLLLYQQIFTRLSKLFSFIYIVDTFLSLSLFDTLSLIAKVAPTHIIYETMLRHWQAFWRSKWVRESEERVTQDDERWIRNVKHAAWVPLQAQNASIATYFIAGFIYIAVECRWYWAWNHINL